MSKRGWFQVDHAGLAEIAKRRGMAFIVTEPIQNAWDERVTQVHVTLTPVPGQPKSDLQVRDDSPDGFRDLTDSFMMFRRSYKLENPEQRGRFNLGEKLILSTAEEARVASTTGTIIFGPKGRTRSPAKTAAGTVLTARLRMTRDEHEEALQIARALIPPPGIDTWVNGELLPRREPEATGSYYLDTEVSTAEGGFKYSNRKCEVRVYKALEGEKPSLYEMGIPIDEVGCPWHVEIMQKVPLSVDRGSVQYGYTKVVERYAGEMMAAVMSHEEARDSWVSRALDFMSDDEAVRAIVKARFGKAVIYDPSSPESNKLALDAGYKVVHGPELSRYAWSTVKRAEALQPAGRIFPDGKVRTGPDGAPEVPRTDWDPDMEQLADYAAKFAEFTIGRHMEVGFYDSEGLVLHALCGNGFVAFNLAAPGMREAMRKRDQEYIDFLLIHECAHDKEKDHLTHGFHRECTRIGAKLRKFEEWL